MARVRAYIGLGANVGDAAGTLAAAVHALAALPDAALGRRVAAVRHRARRRRRTSPSSATRSSRSTCRRDRRAETGASALLIALKDIERAFGRRRASDGGRARSTSTCCCSATRGSRSSDRPGAGATTRPRPSLPLVVPHAEARNRLFVLAPLADLAPDLVPPGWDESVAEPRPRRLAAEGPDAVRPIATWDGEGWQPLA